MRVFPYNVEKSVNYALKWAMNRNPAYYDYSHIGGDCTNFISQCIFSGAKIMNYDFNDGWYYVNANDKSPSWTGVNFLSRFLLNNKGLAPFAKLVSSPLISKGDIIQLGNDGRFFHSLIVTEIKNGTPLVCSHSFDALNKPLYDYTFSQLKIIRILGVTTL